MFAPNLQPQELWSRNWLHQNKIAYILILCILQSYIESEQLHYILYYTSKQKHLVILHFTSPYLKERTPGQYVIDHPVLRSLMPYVYKLFLNITNSTCKIKIQPWFFFKIQRILIRHRWNFWWNKCLHTTIHYYKWHTLQ